MSYCRFGEADVYVYMDVCGALRCCGCTLPEGEPRADDYAARSRRHELEFFSSTEAMIAHLVAHEARGDRVPPDVAGELRRDDAENFPPGGAGPGQNASPLAAG